MLKLVLVAVVALAALALWPRGEHARGPRSRGDEALRAERTPEPRARRRSLPRLHCRDGVPACASASGRIVYVERVDPDGDGDLHVVLADRGGVTARGLTAVDVSKDLRPRRDPRIGDLASTMGPVQTGSFGQSQIHALRFRTRRR